MRLTGWVRPEAVLTAALCALGAGGPSPPQTAPPPPPQYPAYPSETPATLTPATEGFDHVRREVMIPMRDGVKLHTVILLPKGANRAPILLTRTPYNATQLTQHIT